MEPNRKDVSEVASLFNCLHINDNLSSRNENEHEDSTCSVENLNIKVEEKLPNKSIRFEDDLEKEQRDCLENFQSLQLSDDSDNDCTEERENEDSNDALRKRGPDKLALHPSYSYMPYANKHAQGRQPAQPSDDDKSYTDQQYYRDRREIDKIKNFLKSMESSDENRLEVEDFVKKNMASECLASNTAVCSNKVLEDILDMTGNVVTPPIHIPNSLSSVGQEDSSPHSVTSTESGYTSDFPDSRSNSSSPLPVVSNSEPTACANVATTHLSLPYFQIHTFPRYAGTANPFNDSEITLTVPQTVCTTNVKKPATKGKERNKFFVGIKGSLRDKYRRELCSMEKSQEGLGQKDNQGRTILHVAIEKNEVYAITFISILEKSFHSDTRKNGLQHYENLAAFLDQTDTYGYTPLLLACSKNMSRAAQYLLECGASTRVKAHGSVLHYVCQRGKRLLEVADVLCNSASAKDLFGIRNHQQETALHVAVSNHKSIHLDQAASVQEVVDNGPIVCLLMQKGADLCAQDYLGQTALHKAISSNNVDLIGKLHSSTIMDNWDRAVNLQDIRGRTALHVAVRYQGQNAEEQADLLNRLIAMKASPHVRDREGLLPRDYVPGTRTDLLRALDTGCMLELMAGPRNVNFHS